MICVKRDSTGAVRVHEGRWRRGQRRKECVKGGEGPSAPSLVSRAQKRARKAMKEDKSPRSSKVR